MSWSAERRCQLERAVGALGWVVLAVLAGVAVSADRTRTVDAVSWPLVLDVAVGVSLGVSGLVSPGAAAQRALIWSVGAAWLLASAAPVSTVHQALLVAVVALFPVGVPSSVRQAAPLGLALPVLLGAGGQLMAGLALAAGAVASATTRPRSAVAWWFPVVAGFGVGGLLVFVGLLDAIAPAATDPRAVLLVYETSLGAVAVLHFLGMRAVVDEPTRRVRALLVAHRHRSHTDPRPVVEGMLAEALHDPGLRLLFPEPTAARAPDPLKPVLTRLDEEWRVVRRAGVPVAAIATQSRYGADPEVVRAVDEVLALVARSLQLAAERQRHLDELRAARSRLVTAGRLEREQLARTLQESVLPELDHAVTLLQRLEPGPAGLDVGTAHSELVRARREVAALVAGAAPMALGGGRVVEALTDLVRSAPGSVELEVHGAIAAAPEVEAACYHVCAEALANVGKHADARRVVIRLAREPGHGVSVSVTDDGRGGADPEGAGLSGLRDRVLALGGALNVESQPGAGTVLTATFPLP